MPFCFGEVFPIFYESTRLDSFFYEDRDITFPSHIHKQFEVFYLKQGEAAIRLNQSRFVLQAGEMICIFPNDIHSYESIGDTCFYIGLIDPLRLGENGAVLLENKCTAPVISMENLPKEVIGCMDKVASAYKKGEIITRNEWFYGYMNVIADCILRTIPLTPLKQDSNEDILHSVLNYILCHYREDIGLEKVARETGISKYYLSKLFASKIGCSFPEYLVTLRTEYGMELLKEGKKSIREIGEVCGFQSETSFFRNFRRRVGMTPLQYRRQYGEGLCQNSGEPERKEDK